MMTTLDDLAATRERIAALQAERAATTETELSRSDLAKRIKAYAASLDESFTDRIRARLTRVAIGDGNLSAVLSVHPEPNKTIDFAPILVAVMGPKKLAEALTALACNVPETMPAEQRAEAVERIDAELSDLCRIEELQARALESAGLDVVRRADAPVALVLAPMHELEAQ